MSVERHQDQVMENQHVTLCSPDGLKTCFACCPPIRPAGYEHIRYKGIIQRMLRENTRDFKKARDTVVPITGFSCWALGYLDEECRRVGCLLHPEQNRGLDLRCQVDYGEKCGREICPEARIFSELEGHAKVFWLGLTSDLDSFSYSSRKDNPLFHLLDWGPRILGLIAETEKEREMTRASFSRKYPFFATPLPPRAHAYVLNRIVDEDSLPLLKSTRFRADFEGFAMRLFTDMIQEAPDPSEGVPIFRLDMDGHFRNLLRFSLDRNRIPMETAIRLKSMVDEKLDTYSRRIHRLSWKEKSLNS